jgi:hypothetical protein
VCPPVPDRSKCGRDQVVQDFGGGCSGEIRPKQEAAELVFLSSFKRGLHGRTQRLAVTRYPRRETGQAEEIGSHELQVPLADELDYAIERQSAVPAGGPHRRKQTLVTPAFERSLTHAEGLGCLSRCYRICMHDRYERV